MKRSFFRSENIAYLVAWLLVALTPLVAEWMQVVNGAAPRFQWSDVFFAWRRMWPFALLFVVHNISLAPLLVHRQKHGYYLFAVSALVVLFTFYQCWQRPTPPRDFGPGRLPLPELHDVEPGRRPGPPPLLFGQHDIV